MKKAIWTLVLVAVSGLAFAESTVGMKLEPFKDYLEFWTYECQEWREFKELPKSRYVTFKETFEHFEETEGKVVVELGTTRSFVHGGHPGCNLNDPGYWNPNVPENWDWGAGCFTRLAAMTLASLNPEIHTVDLAGSHIERCKVITQDYLDLMHYHVCSSVEYLEKCNFPNGIDLLYLDTGDMWPIEPTAMLQLEEAKMIVKRNLIAPNGYILIDDVKNQTPKKFGEKSNYGKSKYSLPYLLQHGFEIVMDEYQVILRRKQER